MTWRIRIIRAAIKDYYYKGKGTVFSESLVFDAIVYSFE